jgi:Protein of unknown function (DUF3225)
MMQLNRPEVVSQLRAEFERYETALRQHDVATLNDFFLEHSVTLRYGVSEHCYGIDGVRAYRTQTEALPAGRSLLRTVILTFGDDSGSVATEFTGPRAGTIGRQSQTWVRTERGWKIAAAHVSVVDATTLRCFGSARE